MDRLDWAAPGSPYLSHIGRGNAQAELDAAISSWTASQSSSATLQRLSECGVPAERIFKADDIVADPHYAARDMILDVPEPGLGGETVPMPGIVPKLSRTPEI